MPTMQIVFAKHPGKPTTLRCIRDDGSVTWQSYGNHSGFFAVHDLTHYAIETTLGYRQAFWRMIAAGRELGDFGPGDAKTFHCEAIYAETLAGLLTTSQGNGSFLTYTDIKATIDSKAHEAGFDPVKLMEEHLLLIRRRVRELRCEWERLSDSGILTLPFSL